MEIRRTRIEDAKEMADLVKRAVSPHKDQDFTEEGWQRFCLSNSGDGVRSKLAEEGRYSLVVELDGKLVGLISLLGDDKIDQLFVCPAHRRKGIANLLWHSLRPRVDDTSNSRPYWVRSSTVGVPFYESLGFRVVGNKQTIAGISFYLMAYGARAVLIDFHPVLRTGYF